MRVFKRHWVSGHHRFSCAMYNIEPRRVSFVFDCLSHSLGSLSQASIYLISKEDYCRHQKFRLRGNSFRELIIYCIEKLSLHMFALSSDS